MGYFPVRYDSRVVIYERKMFIRLATGHYASRVITYDRRLAIDVVTSCWLSSSRTNRSPTDSPSHVYYSNESVRLSFE